MKRNYKAFSLTFIILIGSIIFAKAQLPFTQHADPPGVTITSARMNDIVVDAVNNKWIAFGNYGVGVYDGVNWTMYNMANSGLPTDSATSIDFDAIGNTWIGTKEGAVYKSGNNYSVFNTSNSGLPANIVTTVLSESGLTWFGTYVGLVSYDGSNWTIYNTSNSGLANDSITAIERDVSGNLWVGTRNGLSKFNNGNWISYTTSNSILNRFILDIEIENNNRIWISCGVLSTQQTVNTTGVFYIDNGVVNDFRTAYLNNEVNVSYTRNLNLTKDASGRIYFRVEMPNTGIVRINGGVLDHFEFYGINVGVQIFGSIFIIDNNETLWTVPRNRFYFYSFDFTGYTQPLGHLTYKNHRTIDINQVKAGINVSGDMHWNYSDPKHEVPKGSGKHSVFASAFWIGGLDAQGQLHMAANTYRQTGKDYWPGPIGGVSVPFDSALCIRFDRIWKIDKWKVEEFKNQFLAGNVTNGTYGVPEEIASWPANGNGVVNTEMAPFIDTNGDGIYDVMAGDYPDIKGDQMLYYIFNDSLVVHTETNGSKLGVEVRASVYAYSCPGTVDSNQVLNWTTLYSYQIINRSINNYNNVYMGLWSDMDLGDYTDDYVASDSTRATGFTYNGDNNDGTALGYGLNPPIQNIKILKGTLADANDGIDNNLNGIIDEPGERTTMNHFQYYNNVNNSPTGNPNLPIDYYNYMRSVWRDGMHVTYGGDGRNPVAAPSNFMFSGVPYGPGWTEFSAGNPFGDRRLLLGSGPFSLASGDTATIDFAYIFTWDSLSPNGLNTSIARNQADLDRVQYWFDNDNFPSCEVYTTGVAENLSSSITIYPNPASTHLIIKTNAYPVNGKKYFVYNLLGAMVKSGVVREGTINIENLSDQLYVLKIETGSGFEFVRFVKM